MSKVSTLSVNDVLVQCEGNIVSDMDGEKVMLNVQRGKYYNLGEVGGDIWNTLGTPSSIKEIINTIQTAYEVEADICEQDIITFLQHLMDEELIRLSNAG
ncbi:lasso peptide biosynthesis PqqD family chaperone [Paenibacillus sp. BR2-3]|uniref:lasso peptide biosynthesis PqqD family chaperone n=1 Tax=Paenibacillus sp. BR2-3 TaxID=3048494 RepID=UPI003977890A